MTHCLNTKIPPCLSFPHSPLILLAPPAVLCSSIASSPTSFLLVRFSTGFSLATFVSTQFWMNSKFSAPVVGTANGVAGGWGNLGGGAAQLIIPIVFGVIRNIGVVKFTAWRIAFFFYLLFFKHYQHLQFLSLVRTCLMGTSMA